MKYILYLRFFLYFFSRCSQLKPANAFQALAKTKDSQDSAVPMQGRYCHLLLILKIMQGKYPSKLHLIIQIKTLDSYPIITES